MCVWKNSAMLQQSELIFDFASDHFNMSQFGSLTDCPAVIVEQVPHSHLLSYTGLACEQLQVEGDHEDLQTGQLESSGQALGQTQKQTRYEL
uniref:Transcription factor Elf N-terminal domain-containing protein n=1 Tax=Amphilophus citrinellus TaxID=61819 RepID=A0A3Q0RT77_AMPCI